MNSSLSKQLMAAGCNALLLSFCLQVTSVSAQNDNLQQRIDAAVAILQQLDTLASACLAELDGTGSSATGNRCVAFLAGVDGELLGQYLGHCRILKDWREQFVSQHFTAATDALDQEAALRQLVGVDYACGEDALQQRTQFVTAAFGQLQQADVASRQASGILHRRLLEQQFDNTLNAERRLLENTLQQQQLQRQLESDRQLQQIENELIRQQRTLPVQ